MNYFNPSIKYIKPLLYARTLKDQQVQLEAGSI